MLFEPASERLLGADQIRDESERDAAVERLKTTEAPHSALLVCCDTDRHSLMPASLVREEGEEEDPQAHEAGNRV